MSSDQRGIFLPNRKDRLALEEELKEEPDPVQFGRLLKELDVQMKNTLSPQATALYE